MSHLSASFSATIRVQLSDAPGTFAKLAQAVGEAAERDGVARRTRA